MILRTTRQKLNQQEQMNLSEDFKLALKRNDYNLVKSYLENGYQANSIDAEGQTPLHFTETKEIAELLIAHGADVNAKSHKGIAPIHLADNPKTVTFLISKGALVNDKGFLGNTPLHSAAFYGDFEVVKILIENGADLWLKNDQQLTPIALAKKNGYFDVVVYLQEKEIDQLNNVKPKDFLNLQSKENRPFNQPWLAINLSDKISLSEFKEILEHNSIRFKQDDFNPIFPRKPYSRILHTGFIEGDGIRKLVEVYTYFTPENKVDFQRMITLNNGNEIYPLIDVFESFLHSEEWKLVNREKHPEDSDPMADVMKVEKKNKPVWVRISRGLTMDLGWVK